MYCPIIWTAINNNYHGYRRQFGQVGSPELIGNSPRAVSRKEAIAGKITIIREVGWEERIDTGEDWELWA